MKVQSIILELKRRQIESGGEFANSKWDQGRYPKIDQQEMGEAELEYQDRKRHIIGPLASDWVVSYTKPLIELQGQPNHRYKSMCGRIPRTGDGRNQILATLRNELERFRNDTVAIIHDGLRGVSDSGRSNDLARKFYLYLREVWILMHRACVGNAKRKSRRSTIGRSKRPNRRIVGSFRNSLYGENGIDPYFSGQHNQRKSENDRTRQATWGFYSHTILMGEMSMTWRLGSVLFGKGAKLINQT